MGRRALVSAVSSARTLHLLATGKNGIDSAQDAWPFYKVLDYYTNSGIYAIHATFSLAELLTLTTFHLYSTTVKFSLEMAEEAVHIFDGLFGETDTSKALAAIIGIFMQELKGQDDALGLTKRFGKVYALGQITKTFVAYICLQYLNRNRWRSLVKLHLIYEGRVPKIKGGYDPSAKVKTKDMFSTSMDPLVAKSPSVSNSLPKLLRKASIEIMGRNQFKSLTKSIASRSYEDLGILPSSLYMDERANSESLKRRRCFSDDTETDFGLVMNKPNVLIPNPIKLFNNPPSKSLKKPSESIPYCSVKKSSSNASLEIKQGARYVQFAVGAYGTAFLKLMGIEKPRQSRFDVKDEHHNHYSLANHTDIPVHHIVSSSFDTLSTLHAPKVHAPVHYVVVDQETKSVVVSLRGTLGLSDIVTDLTAHYDYFVYQDGIDGYVHSGIYNSAKLISKSSIRQAVTDALNSHPSYKLVLTGHSLGGGCAALLSMLWSKRVVSDDGTIEFVTNTSFGFPLRPIHCFVFACPAIMSGDLSKSFKDLVTTFIYRHDVVPCLSLGMVRDFRNITVSFCHEEGLAESVIAKVLGIFREESGYGMGGGGRGSTSPLQAESKERDELWYWALLKTLRADMKAEKLHPPGRVYWINGQQSGFVTDQEPASSTTPTESEDDESLDGEKDKKKRQETTPLSIWEVDDVEIAFSEIVFSTSMFTDHSPHHYEGSLSLLSKLV